MGWPDLGARARCGLTAAMAAPPTAQSYHCAPRVWYSTPVIPREAPLGAGTPPRPVPHHALCVRVMAQSPPRASVHVFAVLWTVLAVLMVRAVDRHSREPRP